MGKVNIDKIFGRRIFRQLTHVTLTGYLKSFQHFNFETGFLKN